MKRKLSVFAMITRAVWLRVLGILGAVVLCNLGGALVFAGRNASLWRLLQMPWLLNVMLFSLTGMCVVLSTAFWGKGQDLFFGRLRHSRRYVFWDHAACNTLCFLLLYLVQTLSLLGICGIFYFQEPQLFGEATVMTACYESAMLHIFLPLSDGLGWAANIMLIVCLGLATAALPCKNRVSNSGISTYLMAGLALFMRYRQWEAGLDFSYVGPVYLIVFSVLTVVAVWGIYSKEGLEDG